jgi:hypothetical protein
VKVDFHNLTQELTYPSEEEAQRSFDIAVSEANSVEVIQIEN